VEKEDLTEEETDEVVADLENPTRVEILINQIQEVLVQEIMEEDLDLEDQGQESQKLIQVLEDQNQEDQKVIQALEDQSLLMQIALQDPEEIEESNIYVKNELTL
jgi:regulator of sirC expression with transglutaminase-like and TPR domain